MANHRWVWASAVLLIAVVLVLPAFAGSYERIMQVPDEATYLSPYIVQNRVLTGGGGDVAVLLQCAYSQECSCDVYVLDRAAGVLNKMLSDSTSFICGARISDNGSKIAMAMKDRTNHITSIRVYDIPTNTYVDIKNGNIQAVWLGMQVLSISGDGKRILTYGFPTNTAGMGCAPLVVFDAVENPTEFRCVPEIDYSYFKNSVFDANGPLILSDPFSFDLSYDGSRVMVSRTITGYFIGNKALGLGHLNYQTASDLNLLTSALMAYGPCPLVSTGATFDGTAALIKEERDYYCSNSHIYTWNQGDILKPDSNFISKLSKYNSVGNKPIAYRGLQPKALSVGEGALFDSSGEVSLYRGGESGTALILNTRGVEKVIAPSATTYALDKGGNHVVFMTNDAMVLEDTDNLPDVYLYDNTAQ